MSVKIVNRKGLELAKDVIAQLRYQKIQSCAYLRATPAFENLRNDKPTDSAQKHMKVIRECSVCAKGALVVAFVKKFNNVTLDNLEETAGDQYELANLLDGFFTIDELNLIEAVFEGDSSFADSVIDGDDELESLDYHAFADKIDKPKQRLRLIMENIVKNGGVFKPAKLFKEHKIPKREEELNDYGC